MLNTPCIQISGPAGAFENYCRAVRSSGGVPLAAYAPDPDLRCDGLLLAGGGDPDPSLFGQADQGSHPPDPARDRAELALVHAFLQAGKPILGICRGMQIINVALGGTLIQDLPPASRPFHGGADHDLIHPLRSLEGSLLYRLYGPVFSVNSAHHQAVDQLGSGLFAMAWSESGFAEGMEHRDLPILGVQFHPERLAFSRRREDAVDGAPLLLHFLTLCRDRRPL